MPCRSALAQEPFANGTLTLNETRIVISYVYASAEPGFFDKSSEDIRVLLSDVALPEPRSMSALARLGRSGQATVVEVVLDARGSPLTGAIYAQAFNGMVSLSGMHLFEPRRWERGRIEGALRSDGPRTFAGVTYAYDARFGVMIPRPPTATELAERLASPEAAAATAYLRAIRAGSLTRFLATLTPAAAAALAGGSGATALAELRADLPPDAAVTDVPTRSATAASVLVQGHRDGILVEYVVTLERAGGAWKVAR